MSKSKIKVCGWGIGVVDTEGVGYVNVGETSWPRKLSRPRM